MADPQRIVDDPDASPLARGLLASAAGDAPAPAHRSAVAKRLGLAAGLLAAGGGEVGAGTVGAALWWKAGLIVLALGGAITGGVVMTREAEPQVEKVAAEKVVKAKAAGGERAPVAVPEVEPPPTTAEPPTTTAAIAEVATTTLPPAPLPPAPPAPRPVAKQPPAAAPPPAAAADTPPPSAASPAPPEAAPPPEAASPPEAAPPPEAASPPAPPALPSPPAPAVDARRLAAEVAVLDRARAALRRGDTAATAAALDEHARDFADGALVAEAELVRIETLARRGDAAAARERAAAFLVRFPQSPLAKRLRSLTGRLPPAAKESP